MGREADLTQPKRCTPSTASPTFAVNVPGPDAAAEMLTSPFFNPCLHTGSAPHLATEVMWHSLPPSLQQSPGQAWPSNDTGANSSVQSLPSPGSAAYISHIDVSALTCDLSSSPPCHLSTSGTAFLGCNASQTFGIPGHLVKNTLV